MATERICPECDARSEATLCPRCGTRTLVERRRDPADDPLIGRILDERYRIDSVIGRGGMGSVFRGTQLATGQVVAIKVIRSDLAENTEAAKRFHREARAASVLTHPHTIRVFDFGQSDEGDLYMVLEHLSGRTLGNVRKAEGRLPEARIAGIACEVCQSLMEAHGLGLAHRDLKPDNVMLLDAPGHPDFVKVLDFGIAKLLTGSSGESSVTRSGVVVGTPQYMAPEQAQGSVAISPAVDLYALGVVVFEALSGTKPFDGDSAVGILMAHVRDPVPEIPADLSVSPEARALVRRMLAKSPAERPGPAEAAQAFDRLRGDSARVPVPAPRANPAPGANPAPTAAEPGPAGDEPTRALPTFADPDPAAPAHGRTRRRAIVGLAVAAAVAGVVGVALGGGGAKPEPARPAETVTPAPVVPGEAVTPVPVAPAATPAAPSAASEAPSPPPEPSSIRVRFASVPSGARVLEGARELGTTPFQADLPGPAGERTFVFRLAGYRDAPVVVRVEGGARVEGRLDRIAAVAPSSVRRPAAAPSVAPAPARPAPARTFRPLED